MMKKTWMRKVLQILSICCLSGVLVQAAEPADTFQQLEPQFVLKEQVPVHFTDADADDYVLSGYVKGAGYGPSHVAAVMTYDEMQKKWTPIYQSERKYAPLHVLSGNLLNNKRDQLVLYKHEGSGAFLSYDVLAWLNEKPQVLLSRSAIFQGNVEITNGQLVEHMGHQDTVYRWKGKRLIAKELPEEIAVPAGHTISFSIGNNGIVYTSQQSLTMKVGETMQLHRLNRGIRERVLYNGQGALTCKDDLFTANKPGTSTITIIPDGYNWDKAVKIVVRVIV